MDSIKDNPPIHPTKDHPKPTNKDNPQTTKRPPPSSANLLAMVSFPIPGDM